MPWGERRFGSVLTEIQYTGQYRDEGLGLDYFNDRWYDPRLGRFAQADTLIHMARQGGEAL
jgi:RHS repeat-associated protein